MDHGKLRVAVMSAVLAAAAFAALAPALDGEFLPWDDEKALQNETRWRGLGPAQLRHVWTSAPMGHYVPVAWMSLGPDHVLWGMDPRGYHLTSLILHAANAVLLFLLGRRILAYGAGPLPAAAIDAGAFAAAALHATHPTRAESVAWITERKDVLCGTFVLLAAHAYVRRAGRGRFPRAALALFVLALLSKGTAIALPAALLALDGPVLRRLPGAPWRWRGPAVWQVLVEKLPFLAVAAASGIATLAVARYAMSPTSTVGLGARLAAASFSLSFHLEKLVLPLRLPIIEPMPPVLRLLDARYGLRAAALATLAAFALALGRRWPALPWSLATYAAFVLPVSGLLQAGPQLAAVRYGYLATMPLCLLGGVAFSVLVGRGGRTTRLLLGGLLVLVAGLEIRGARQEARVWRDGRSLWTAGVARNPEAPSARHGLAIVLHRERRYGEALAQLDAGLATAPNHPDLLMLAALLRGASPHPQERDPAEAVRFGRAAVARTPSAWARWSLAVALASAGDARGALSELRRARADAEAQRIGVLVAQIDRVLPDFEAGKPYRLPAADVRRPPMAAEDPGDTMTPQKLP